MKSRVIRWAAMALLAPALLTACSKASGSTGVASIDGKSTPTTDASGGGKLTEAKALEFAKCMRDHGLTTFPDPTVDAQGNVRLFGPGGPGGAGGGGTGGATASSVPNPRQDPSFDTARQACSPIIAGLTFGGGRGGFGNSPELQDALVKFSDCMRGEGLDVGDLSVGGAGGQNGAAGQNAGGQNAGGQNAGGQNDAGTPPAGADGGQRGPGGDPAARIAQRLGLDPNDPKVAGALTKCQPILTAAFAAARPSGGGS